MNHARPAPGTPMVFQWRKWDGSPHWRGECVYLGADDWGDWVGQPIGWRSARPGATFTAQGPNVTLIPRTPDAGGADFALTVTRDHPRGTRIYIDIGWDVRWEGTDAAGAPDAVAPDAGATDRDLPVLATGIDMDLDVVRVVGDRGTWVDDRDEWEEHRVRYGYPADVVRRLEALALQLEREVRAQHPPFDDATGDHWLDRLADLRLDRLEV
ncbi:MULTISPECIES: hypothetical protein [Microbacterium]|uniref:hypothetical protein n=1 Tax=Microbacterium TaxID=33882 RepID=UPI00217CC4DA|nr:MULTISPECIES: hypothetical protein [Microbacterium]UWF77217.1 hypothetical protein JSY13_10560 [Microbacterium neungamense]WCM55373.1 hypothetical protein JRG78_10545 [Microbacterium sp. EF45047]